MKREEQVTVRANLAECRMLDDRKNAKYHQGWKDALEWVRNDAD